MSEGFKAAVLTLLVILAIAGLIWPLALGAYFEQQERKRRNEPPIFDERQRLVRLRACAHGLCALLGLGTVWTALDLTGRFPWTDSIIDLFLCALVLFNAVWTLDTLLHDAYAGWRTRNSGSASLIAMYMLFLANAFRTGAVTATWLPMLFACAGFSAVLGAVLWKQRREKVQAGETP